MPDRIHLGALVRHHGQDCYVVAIDPGHVAVLTPGGTHVWLPIGGMS